MKPIHLVKCVKVMEDDTFTITRDSQIRAELNSNAPSVIFEDEDGVEYSITDLLGKTVTVGKKEVAVGKKRPVKRYRVIEDDDY